MMPTGLRQLRSTVGVGPVARRLTRGRNTHAQGFEPRIIPMIVKL